MSVALNPTGCQYHPRHLYPPRQPHPDDVPCRGEIEVFHARNHACAGGLQSWTVCEAHKHLVPGYAWKS